MENLFSVVDNTQSGGVKITTQLVDVMMYKQIINRESWRSLTVYVRRVVQEKLSIIPSHAELSLYEAFSWSVVVLCK